MSHFAEIDGEGTVLRVLVVADDKESRGQEFLADDLGLGGTWKKTSYNTVGGVHSNGGTPFRKNFAGIGYKYDAAKDAQGLLEAKINRMETELASARILDASTIDTSKVSILTKVTITNKATQKSVTYQIVSEKEADLKMQKISVTSPIGKGLLGKKVGDLAEVVAPNGKMVFTIDHIAV